MSNEKHVDSGEDQELNDLLDSALKDFDKTGTTDTKDGKDAKGAKDAKDAKNILESTTTESTSDNNQYELLDEAWTRDFIKQVADQFEENLQRFTETGVEGDSEISFERIARTVAGVMNETDSIDGDNTNTDFQSAIAQGLTDLMATSKNVQGDIDVSDMLAQTVLEDSTVLQFMRGMMQHLVSKEILHTSLKELVDRYPKWLAEKKDTLSPTELQRLSKQLDLMQKACQELEKEEDDDSEEEKKKRFETIVALLSDMHDCGKLPDDLIPQTSLD